MSNYRTAESVSPKHPDKLADRVSDTILDAYLAKDPDSRVAIDVAGGHGKLFITGEVSSRANVDLEIEARKIVGDKIAIISQVADQSPEIARGVDAGGAGDQGIMIGYATSETPEFLPLEVVLARRLNQYLYKLWPHDGKTQVTLNNSTVVTIVASFQNAPKQELVDTIHNWLKKEQIVSSAKLEILANPAGDWEIGGFDADAGLTGRKLIIDNYGPRVPIGGGAFSGKDPSKVDRSAAYMARRVALDYLKSRNANEVLVRLAYAIGHVQPLEATVSIDGREEVISGYDLSPSGIIKYLDLKRPIYSQTAAYGHFGHSDFTWE